MTNFTRRMIESQDVTHLRRFIMLDHWIDGKGALTIDLCSYSSPDSEPHGGFSEWEDRLLHLTFTDRASFKRSWQMARSIVRK